MSNSTETTSLSYETSGNAIAIPVFCILAIISAGIPFKEHLARNNVPMCSLIIVLCVHNFIQFVSTILWPNDDFSKWWKGYGWCDVSQMLIDPIITSVSTTTCCITMNLARAFDIDNPVSQTAAAKRRKIIIDVVFCFTVPVLQIILHYVVQSNRYNILTIYGCQDSLDSSWPTILIVWIWAPVYGIINVYYALLVVYRLRKHRDTFSRTLSSSGSSLTSRGFMKLFFFASSLLIIFFPIVMYFFYLNMSQLYTDFYPYSWSRIHDSETWNMIPFIPLADQPGVAQFIPWSPIVQSALTFFFFGMGGEAREHYRQILVKCGLAKIWPSLREPRGSNNRFGSRTESTASWYSRMDVVGLALRYFDKGSRKASEGTFTECSIHSKSRKASAATFEHLSLSESPASPRKQSLKPDTLSTSPLSYPQPSYRGFDDQPSSTQYHTCSFLSPFRTQINLPFPLFHHKSKTSKNDTSAQCTCSTNSFLETYCQQTQPHHETNNNTQLDLEAQIPSTSQLQSQDPDTITFAAPTAPAVQTQIWSDRASLGDSPLIDDEWEPKMGTRAYRERERREMEALKKEGLFKDTVVEQSSSS